MGLLVSFSGIDGAGKTTLSKLVLKELNIGKIKFKYVYGRLNPLISKPLIIIGRRILMRKKDVKKDYKVYSSAKKNFLKNHSTLSKIYYFVLLFDYLLQLLIKVRLRMIFDRNLICDRYVYDTIITDLAVDFGLNEEQILELSRKFFKIVPKPTIAFLIDLPETIAFQRKSDTPSMNYLKERREIYLRIAKKEGMVILNGCEDIHKIKRKVVEMVVNCCQGDIK